MSNLWLQIKAWTKGILIFLLLMYAALFIYNNSGPGKEVDFWWWFKRTHDTNVFMLALWAFLAGVLTTIIVRTTWVTWRQIREARLRSRTDKLEREMADMQSKAAMLQTKPVVPSAQPGVTVEVDRLSGRS